MDWDNGWMYEFAAYIFQTPTAPLVVSMSYAWFENDQCSNDNNGGGLGNCTYLHIPNWRVYLNRTNTEFKKLGVLGHTVLAAAGDDGTAGGHQSEDGCTTLGPCEH